ncbi:MAG TPA: hypothetical protein VIH57_06060 [Bacteroidales bacterium]
MIEITGTRTRNRVILAALILINFLFAYKYLIRITPFALPFSMIYSVLNIPVYYFLQKQKIISLDSSMLFWGTVVVYVSLYLILFRYIKVEQLNVDRWSIIAGFWHNAFGGKYPYDAQSHMGNYPGPLPVYFLLSLPFYMVGEIGYLSLSGFICFTWFTRKQGSSKDSFISLILLVSSVALFWEITVRSTVFINAVLFLIYLHWLTRIDINKTKQFLISAILGGLLLSTRSIFALVLVVYAIHALKNKLISFERMFWWTTLLLLTLAVTFMPFLIFFFREFLKMNPFLVQSEFLLPFWYAPILLCIAGLTGIICKQTNDLFFWTGMVFFSVFIIYALRLCIIHGCVNAYLNSIIDLSYLLFSFPFLLFSLRKEPDKRIV